MRRQFDEKARDELAQEIRQQIEAHPDSDFAELSESEREDYADRLVASSLAKRELILRVSENSQDGENSAFLAQEMPLDDWLATLLKTHRGESTWDWSFPTDRHREQYLASLYSRSIREIKGLLYRFLMVDEAFARDEEVVEYIRIKFNRAKSRGEKFDLGGLSYADRRILMHYLSHGKIKPRDSIAWVVDMIDWSPLEAMNALRTYISAHWMRLPDGRINGLFDTLAIMRAICMQSEPRANVLDMLTSRDFEVLVANLYSAMGFETELTAQTRDGGRDVLAVKTVHGLHVTVRVDAKHWTRKVGLPEVRQIHSVIEHEKAVKGVIVTSSSFTRDARRFEEKERRIQLIDRGQLCQLLNERFGTGWPNRVDRLITPRSAPNNSQKF